MMSERVTALRDRLRKGTGRIGLHIGSVEKRIDLDGCTDDDCDKLDDGNCCCVHEITSFRIDSVLSFILVVSPYLDDFDCCVQKCDNDFADVVVIHAITSFCILNSARILFFSFSEKK